jgi:hypothetical protein
MSTTGGTAGEESFFPPGKVLHCATEEEYYTAIDNAGDKVVVVDCFAEWYVRTGMTSLVSSLFSLLEQSVGMDRGDSTPANDEENAVTGSSE